MIRSLRWGDSWIMILESRRYYVMLAGCSLQKQRLTWLYLGFARSCIFERLLSSSQTRQSWQLKLMINTKEGGRNTICKNLKIVHRVPISTQIWPYEWKINFKLQATICTPLQVNTNRISEEILVKCSEFLALQSIPVRGSLDHYGHLLPCSCIFTCIICFFAGH